MRRLFGRPDIVSLTEKVLMARKFFRIFTENNPARATGKNIIIYARREQVLSIESMDPLKPFEWI